jgi:hypothetical protein
LARSSFAKSCGSIVTVQRGFCLNLSALAIVRVTAISLLPKNTEISRSQIGWSEVCV